MDFELTQDQQIFYDSVKRFAVNELADGAVDAAAIADGSVTTDKLANGAVDSTKIATGAVGSTQIANGGVATIDLADGAVTTPKLADSAVTTPKLADGSVTDSVLDGGSIGVVETGIVGSRRFKSIARLHAEPPPLTVSSVISTTSSSFGQSFTNLLWSAHQVPPVINPLRDFEPKFIWPLPVTLDL